MNLSESLAILSCIVFCTTATAKPKEQQKPEVPNTEVPSLNLQEGISDKIYQSTTASVSSQSESFLTVDSSVRFYAPSELTLTNRYFNVPYTQKLQNIVGFSITPRTEIANLNSAKLASFVSVGFAYLQSIFDVQPDIDLTVRDAIELQWIPLQTGLELTTRNYTSQRVSASLIGSAGVDWFTQSGQLDGMNQTFWIPRYEAGAAVTLFGGDNDRKVGFSGVRVAGLAYRSFSSKQSNRGWSAEVGSRYGF